MIGLTDEYRRTFAASCSPLSTMLAACLAVIAIGIRFFTSLTTFPVLSLPETEGIYRATNMALKKVIDNQMLQAVVVSGAVGIIAYFSQQLYTFIYEKLRGLFLSSISIKNTDENFHTILDFISEKCVKEDSPAMMATSRKKRLHWRKAYIEYLNGASEAAQM